MFTGYFWGTVENVRLFFFCNSIRQVHIRKKLFSVIILLLDILRVPTFIRKHILNNYNLYTNTIICQLSLRFDLFVNTPRAEKEGLCRTYKRYGLEASNWNASKLLGKKITNQPLPLFFIFSGKKINILDLPGIV